MEKNSAKRTLKGLPNCLTKTSNMCSLAQNGKCLISDFSKAADIFHSKSWVIDSSSTDHMTHYSNKFDNYVLLPRNKKILVADGSAIPIAGHGNIKVTLLLSYLMSYMFPNC